MLEYGRKTIARTLAGQDADRRKEPEKLVSRHEKKKLPAGSKMRVAFLTLAMQHRTESSPLFPRFHVFAPVRTSVDLVAGWQGGGFRCLCCTIVQLFVDTSACDLSMMAIRTRVYIVRTYPLFVL